MEDGAVCLISCKHEFHHTCIDKWARSATDQAATCPMCRVPLPASMQMPSMPSIPSMPDMFDMFDMLLLGLAASDIQFTPEPITVPCTNLTFQFQSMDALEVAYRVLSDPAERERFNAEYEGAKARGDYMSTIMPAHIYIEQMGLYILSEIDLGFEIDQFLTKMKPVMLSRLMLAVIHDQRLNVQTEVVMDLFRNKVHSATDELDRKLYTELMGRLAAFTSPDQMFNDLDLDRVRAVRLI
jgi:hypothetical protein